MKCFSFHKTYHNNNYHRRHERPNQSIIYWQPTTAKGKWLKWYQYSYYLKRHLLSKLSSINETLPAVFTLAVVLKVTTECYQNDNGGKSPANQHIDHAHVAVGADWSSTGEIKRQSFHHHPGKGGHEQKVDESCHYFTSSLVVEKTTTYSSYENKITLSNFKKNED